MSETREVVEVWRVDLRQPPERVERAAALLAPEERARAERGAPAVRRRRVMGRAALRIALSRYLGRAPASLRLATEPRGKPVLADEDDVHFSLSASGESCLIAATTLGPIGVDVELLRPRPRLERIAERRLSPRESRAILALDGERRLRAFYNCWTRREAYLKARGLGLSGLDQVVVSVDDERPKILSLTDDDPSAWTLAAVDPGPGLVGAVAVRGALALPDGVLKAPELSLREELG